MGTAAILHPGSRLGWRGACDAWGGDARNMYRNSMTMESVRDLTSTLWTLRTSQETARVLRTTYSLLRFFLFFDICYLISGIALVTMALANQMEERSKMVLYGGLFGLFASVSAICNFLAGHGLRTWRRKFLLPWLLFFLIILGVLTMCMTHDIWNARVHWRHIFLFLATMFVITCWRHMQKQYILMSFPRPSFSITADVEAAVREVLQPLPITPKDAPPRYEEVAQDPPAYEEAVSNRNSPASASL